MISDYDKQVDEKKKKHRRIRWRYLIPIITIPLGIGLGIAWYSLQPSLTLAFFNHSKEETFEMVLDDDSLTMPYRIMVPDDAGPDHRYPVVLYLCGSAQCGTDNVMQGIFDVGFVDRLASTKDEAYKCIVIAPQIPDEGLAIDKEILAGYMDLIESVQKKYNADSARLYLLGFSMGADSIWALLDQYPDKIAAAVPICGGLEDPNNAAKFKDVPIWMFHGALDTTYPVRGAQEMANALKNLGGNIKYTEYEFDGHICWQKAYAEPDLLPWMFAQFKTNHA